MPQIKVRRSEIRRICVYLPSPSVEPLPWCTIDEWSACHGFIHTSPPPSSDESVAPRFCFCCEWAHWFRTGCCFPSWRDFFLLTISFSILNSFVSLLTAFLSVVEKPWCRSDAIFLRFEYENRTVGGGQCWIRGVAKRHRQHIEREMLINSRQSFSWVLSQWITPKRQWPGKLVCMIFLRKAMPFLYSVVTWSEMIHESTHAPKKECQGENERKWRYWRC